MAKQIALNLTINGVKNSITNINQLNQAIKEAEEDLKDIEIGSDNFKKLASEIKNAKNIVEDLGESFKGQDLEKRVGSFAKVGEAVTSSFAGAQAALSLFGAESDEVAKAAAQAQSLLTVALAARSAAEGVVAVRTVAQTIATSASAAAANAANVATKALYTTLAANPYGAILAVIGLVVGALLAFSTESEKAINVTQELSKATSSEADALKESLTILTRLNPLKALQRQEIEKLTKTYPGFNAFIDKENKLTQDGVKFIQLRIKQYELEAQAKLLIQKIAENQIKILEIEASSSIETVSFWQKAVNAIKSGGNVATQAVLDFQSGIKNQREEIEKVNKTTDIYRNALENVRVETDKVLTEIEPYNKKLQEQDKLNDKLAENAKDRAQREKEAAEAYKAGRNAIISFTEELKKLDDIQKQYSQTIENLSKLKYEVKIIEDLNRIKETRKTATQELVKYTNDYISSINKLSDALPQDIFLDIFTKFRSELEKTFVKGGNNFKLIYSTFLDTNKDLNREQQKFLFDIADGYEKFTALVDKTPGFRKIIENFGGINAAFDDFRGILNITTTGSEGFLNALGDISAAAGDFKFELDAFGDVVEFPFNPDKVRRNAEQALVNIKKGLFEPTVKFLLEEKEKSLNFLASVAKPEDVANIKGQLDKVREVIKKFNETGKLDFGVIKLEEVNTQIDKTIDGFTKLLSSIVKAEQEVFRINVEVNKLTSELNNNTEELSRAIGGTILLNIDAISNLLLGARTKEQKLEKDFIEKIKKDRAGLEKFKQDLLAKNLAVSKANEDDLLAAYIEFKKKEVDVTKQAEKDKQEAQQETYSKILKGFELFSTTLNQISGLVNERTQTDLESLAAQSKRLQDQVIGDSETAAKKREEIQIEYEKKSKEIEKKGRITSLRFSQAQTIANTAQAVVKALAELGPILGPILAGVNTAIGVAQIAIIEDQISNARSLRRGGVVRAQGGMIIGPSHENGGVRLAQAGIIAEGNESIINRQSTLDYQSLLSSINVAGGGRPLVYNNFDDSRIVEAIAKQQQKPIRAYVLGSEITNEQAVSKRLDDLSKI